MTFPPQGLFMGLDACSPKDSAGSLKTLEAWRRLCSAWLQANRLGVCKGLLLCEIGRLLIEM